MKVCFILDNTVIISLCKVQYLRHHWSNCDKTLGNEHCVSLFHSGVNNITVLVYLFIEPLLRDDRLHFHDTLRKNPSRQTLFSPGWSCYYRPNKETYLFQICSDGDITFCGGGHVCCCFVSTGLSLKTNSGLWKSPQFYENPTSVEGPDQTWQRVEEISRLKCFFSNQYMLSVFTDFFLNIVFAELFSPDG